MQPSQTGLEPQPWAAKCDPFTLVGFVRESLHDESKKNDPYVKAANAEIISRFELQQRAGAGASLVGSGSESATR